MAPPLGFVRLNEHGSPPGPPESPAPREDKKKKRDEDSTGGGGALTPKRNKAKTAYSSSSEVPKAARVARWTGRRIKLYPPE